MPSTHMPFITASPFYHSYSRHANYLTLYSLFNYQQFTVHPGYIPQPALAARSRSSKLLLPYSALYVGVLTILFSFLYFSFPVSLMLSYPELSSLLLLFLFGASFHGFTLTFSALSFRLSSVSF